MIKILFISFWILYFTKFIFTIVLEKLNIREILKNQDQIPDHFKDHLDKEKYQQTIKYNIEKINFQIIIICYDALLTALILWLGLIPKIFSWLTMVLPFTGNSIWLAAAFIIIFFQIISLLHIPFDLYRIFVIETKHGFNKITFPLWVTDQIKGLLLSLIIAVPLLFVILLLVETLGEQWWYWAFGVVLLVQFFLQYLFPKFILPLFNKITPLEPGKLKDRLFELSQKINFPTKEIMIMDASKRSLHSNAFFTGFGKNKRIILFDTLIKQLSPLEITAVLAHEIGHFVKKHLLKSMLFSIIFLFLTFYIIDFAKSNDVINIAFSLEKNNIAQTIVFLALVGSTITFWLTPLFNLLSRKNEYEADAFSKKQLKGSKHLISALKKLAKENLSNLTPHQFYSFFYYSHPTLLEREQKLKEDV